MRLGRRHDKAGSARYPQINFLQGGKRFHRELKGAFPMIFNDVGTHRFENIDHPFIPLAVMEVQAGDREFGESMRKRPEKRHRRPIASHGYFTAR